jgi:pyrimidine operon attenuation protein/uracil phosphoribosyltransferase
MVRARTGARKGVRKPAPLQTGGALAALRERLVLMDRQRLARTLARMAHEMAERHPDMSRTVLVGIRTRGVPLARRLAGLLRETCGGEPRVGALDITLYRDDLTTVAAQPILKGTDFSFSIDEMSVILVDDVLFTGRTVRAALDELIDYGRPARIELAVVVDRGRTLPTSRDEVVRVMLDEEDSEDRVVLLDRPGARRRPARRPRGGRR